MGTLIFDIETVGEDFEKMDETTQHVLTKWIKETAQNEAEYTHDLNVIKNRLGFSPFTGSVVAIGMYDLEKQKGAVYYQHPGNEGVETVVDGIKYKTLSEKAMLELFWQKAKQYDTFVTFSGYGFDVPFLLVRSAVHHIRPTRNLMTNRYLSSQKQVKHIDLADQLSFYGAMRKKPSLHLVCRAFDVVSPKAGGVSGDDVGALFTQGEYETIAKYNMGDVIATKDVYLRWQECLK
jgi:predicted PolB exonuclease-like 3'-5' exonuclease